MITEVSEVERKYDVDPDTAAPDLGGSAAWPAVANPCGRT